MDIQHNEEEVHHYLRCWEMSLIERWDSDNPLISSLKFLYSLKIVSPDEIIKLTNVLGIDQHLIFSNEFIDVNTILGKIKGYTPIINIVTAKQLGAILISLKAQKIEHKIYDGSFGNVTLITPAQFLNVLSNLKIPFNKFTLNWFPRGKEFDRYLYAISKYTFYYKITINTYVPTHADIPSAWLSHYLKMQSQYVSVENELLEQYNDDTDWWKYPWISDKGGNIDVKKLRDVSIKYGVPLQLLKSVWRDKSYAEKMLKLNGYSEEIINKVVTELFPNPS